MSSPCLVAFFCVLTCPCLCNLQLVSAPPSVDFLYILTLSLLPSPGSKYLFKFLINFWCTNVFLPLCIFQKVNLSFVSACSLHSHFFAFLHCSYYSPNYDHLAPTYCFFFLILSWFHQCTFSRLSVYLVVTRITPWSVHFRYMHLYLLTSKIVTILALEHASLLSTSPSRPTLVYALDQSFSKYEYSDTHNALKEQFPLPPKQYSISEFTTFVLSHRLR